MGDLGQVAKGTAQAAKFPVGSLTPRAPVLPELGGPRPRAGGPEDSGGMR